MNNNNYFNIDIENIFNKNINIYKNKKIENIPNELLDPITFDIIIEPYYLPNKILIDKYTIFEYLLDKEENPFNKLKLTIELNDYNNTDNLRNNIKKKVNYLPPNCSFS